MCVVVRDGSGAIGSASAQGARLRSAWRAPAQRVERAARTGAPFRTGRLSPQMPKPATRPAAGRRAMAPPRLRASPWCKFFKPTCPGRRYLSPPWPRPPHASALRPRQARSQGARAGEGDRQPFDTGRPAKRRICREVSLATQPGPSRRIQGIWCAQPPTGKMRRRTFLTPPISSGRLCSSVFFR